MKTKQRTLFGSALLCSVAAMAACSSTQRSASVAPAPASVAQGGPGARSNPALKDGRIGADALRQKQAQSSLDALRRGETPTTPAGSPLREVYFDFDRYDLSSDARATLKAAADWLKQNPAARVDIEGHCDERGTTEYNLALGAKRAQSAKDYLVSLGIAANRLSTNSFGEEIPVCREPSESCWQKNRRDRFVALSAKPGV